MAAMIYEERRIVLRRGALLDFQRYWHETLAPATVHAAGRLLCFLGGMIGNPADELLQFTRFPDVTAWENAQRPTDPLRGQFIEREEARLLRAFGSRPKERVPATDRRAMYGYRRFFVKGSDLAEFVQCSTEGVWPRLEAQGASVLGLWTTLAAGEPREIVMLTGYHSPTHWDATRTYQAKPADMPQALWDNGMRLLNRRNELTLRTWVCLMRAIELE
jgi:hypothetical protein